MLLFNTLRIDDEVIMDKIIEKLLQDNDKCYIEHVIDSNKFILSKENKNFEKASFNSLNI